MQQPLSATQRTELPKALSARLLLIDIVVRSFCSLMYHANIKPLLRGLGSVRTHDQAMSFVQVTKIVSAAQGNPSQWPVED